MFSTIKFKKMTKALLATGLVFAANSYAGDEGEQHTIKVKQLHDDVKVMVQEGSDVRVIKLSKSELGSDELAAQLEHLPESAREKVEQVLAQIDMQDDDGVFVFSDKVIQSFDGTEKKMVFVSGGEDFHFELPPEPPLPPGAPKSVKPTKVVKFSFSSEGEGNHTFKVISSLLKDAELTPEQIDELQTLLNEK